MSRLCLANLQGSDASVRKLDQDANLNDLRRARREQCGLEARNLGDFRRIDNRQIGEESENVAG